MKSYDVAASKESVFWTLFKEKIQELFLVYHGVEKGGQNGEYTLYQTSSCFDHLPIDPETIISPVSNRRLGVLSPEPDEERYRRTAVGACNEKGMLISKTAEGNLKHQLCFFRPAFVLKYNEAKKKLADLEESIYTAEDSLYRCKKDLAALSEEDGHSSKSDTPPPQPPDTRSRFSAGTAVETRKNSNWRAFTLQSEAIMNFGTEHSSANLATETSLAGPLPSQFLDVSMSGSAGISPPNTPERRGMSFLSELKEQFFSKRLTLMWQTKQPST